MCFLSNSFSSLHARAHRSVEHEEREEGRVHKTCTTEEEGAKLWILTFAAICSVKEPYRCVDTNAKASVVRRIAFCGSRRTVETILQSKVRQGADLTGWP